MLNLLTSIVPHTMLLTALLHVIVAGGDSPVDDKAMCRVMWSRGNQVLTFTLNLFTLIAPHAALLIASLRVTVAGGDSPVDDKAMCRVMWSREVRSYVRVKFVDPYSPTHHVVDSVATCDGCRGRQCR